MICIQILKKNIGWPYKICKKFINIFKFFFNFIFLYFSDEDLAFVIKYIFSENTEPDIKKKKIEERKNENVINYSFIKLPAFVFLRYLETYASQFIDDCVR